MNSTTAPAPSGFTLLGNPGPLLRWLLAVAFISLALRVWISAVFPVTSPHRENSG